MNCNIGELAFYVEHWLKINKNLIQSFYIGKTEDFQRRASEHLNEGYEQVLRIAEGKAQVIGKAEEFLIAQSLQSPLLKDKCNNISPDAEGNPDADVLYLAYTKTRDEGLVFPWPKTYTVTK